MPKISKPIDSVPTVEFARRQFSIPETAAYLRISESSVFKLMREKKLAAAKIGHRTIISGREIERLLSAA